MAFFSLSQLLLCPQAVSLVIRPLAAPSPLLRDLLAASTISSLDLGSPKLTLTPLQFEEDVVPILRSLGPRLTSLTLYRLPDIDVLMLAELCPRLTLLRWTLTSHGLMSPTQFSVGWEVIKNRSVGIGRIGTTFDCFHLGQQFLAQVLCHNLFPPCF